MQRAFASKQQPRNETATNADSSPSTSPTTTRRWRRRRTSKEEEIEKELNADQKEASNDTTDSKGALPTSSTSKLEPIVSLPTENSKPKRWRLPRFGRKSKSTSATDKCNEVETTSSNRTEACYITGSSSNCSTTTASKTDDEDTMSKQKSSRSWPRRSTGKIETTTTNEPNPEKKQQSRNATSDADDTSTTLEADGVTPTSGNETIPQKQQQQGVIIIGTPSSSSHSGRPSDPEQRQHLFMIPTQGRSGTAVPTMVRPTNNNNNVNSVVLTELLGSVASTALRVWLLTWLTRRTQEESISPTQHFCWERLNDKFSRDAAALSTAMDEPPYGVSRKAWHRHHVRKVLQPGTTKARGSLLANNKINNKKQALATVYTRTVVVIELHTGENPAKSYGSTIDLESMPDVVTFLLHQQRRHAFGTCRHSGQPMELEVLLSVNSPGGPVATYGLAAAQLRRLKGGDARMAGGNTNKNYNNITTTVCVDKFAASGGYMIASQADKLIAAPFATIGSVGVILEGLNFHELAKRYGVQPLIVKAGDSKNPLSQWGPVTPKDLKMEQQRLVKVHDAFKTLVLQGRPALFNNLEQVTDGSIYLGQEAMDLGMVDAVMTTDEYILERIEAGDRVLKLHRTQQGRYPRQLRLSPLDILPHIRNWVSQGVSMLQQQDGGEGVRLITQLVRTSTWIGFVSHLVKVYVNR